MFSVSLGKGVFGPLTLRGGLGDPSPILGRIWPPWCLEGGLGRSPHSRAYLAPSSEEGGLGILPHSRANLRLVDNYPFLLNTIHCEGTGYAGACHQHVYLINTSAATNLPVVLRRFWFKSIPLMDSHQSTRSTLNALPSSAGGLEEEGGSAEGARA